MTDCLCMYIGLLKYSGTPPYDHPVYKTTSLLRPYSFKPNVKTIESFSYFEDPVNATTSLLRPGFYGPTVVTLTGFHCSWSHDQLSVNTKTICFEKMILRWLVLVFSLAESIACAYPTPFLYMQDTKNRYGSVWSFL